MKNRGCEMLNSTATGNHERKQLDLYSTGTCSGVLHLQWIAVFALFFLDSAGSTKTFVNRMVEGFKAVKC